MYDVVIIGGGVAGLSAAIYAARAGKKTLVLEGMMCGGQIVNSPKVSNYPGIKEISGFELATSLYEQAQACGAGIDYQKVVSVEDRGDTKLVITDSDTIECKNVIIATGAKHRELGLDNENELVGKGISYCATCDGAFYKDKTVAVIGGGNTALMDALYLSKLCSKVYLIHRREEFRGKDGILNELCNTENVEILRNCIVKEAVADDTVKAIIVENVITHDTREYEVSGIFVAVGQMPDTKLFEGLVDMDEYGYIKADESLKTNVPGIYVAGDCRTKEVRQLATAAADGAIAGSKI